MSDTIQSRLEAMGITLPQASAPAANYVPFVQQGNLLYISGQLPLVNGMLSATGTLGDNVSTEEGQAGAKDCAINILAQINAALDGDLERIERVVKISGFVASTPSFNEHHLVINGASNFLAEALGERGVHARAAVGVASLPLGAAVEIEAIIAVK